MRVFYALCDLCLLRLEGCVRRAVSSMMCVVCDVVVVVEVDKVCFSRRYSVYVVVFVAFAVLMCASLVVLMDHVSMSD